MLCYADIAPCLPGRRAEVPNSGNLTSVRAPRGGASTASVLGMPSAGCPTLRRLAPGNTGCWCWAGLGLSSAPGQPPGAVPGVSSSVSSRVRYRVRYELQGQCPPSPPGRHLNSSGEQVKCCVLTWGRPAAAEGRMEEGSYPVPGPAPSSTLTHGIIFQI